MPTAGASKGHGGPRTKEKSPMVITSMSKMSTECSSGDQSAVHTAQKYVESYDLDHAKFGTKQT
eukprot:11180118-Lingulodinium_polyedra.AAC.1